MTVQTNLEQIQNNIRQACEKVNRNPNEITLIGVTKYVTIERMEEAIVAGVENIGENRAEDFTEKYDLIENEVKWHFIGTLQSRKARDVINKVAAIHSLDRESLAKQINTRSIEPLDCFVQVNVSGEESKHGLSPEEVIPFIEKMAAYEKVNIVGLMTMAPHVEDEQELRDTFRRLAVIRDSVKEANLSNAPCEYLSMGMSNDYEIAIEEGATHIRVGSKLVGS